jgi:hypothetical protein
MISFLLSGQVLKNNSTPFLMAKASPSICQSIFSHGHGE